MSKLGLLHIRRQNGTNEVHCAIEAWDGWHIVNEPLPVIGALPKRKVLKQWLQDGFIRKCGIIEIRFVEESSHPMKVVHKYLDYVREDVEITYA